MSKKVHWKSTSKTVYFGAPKEHFCPTCNSKLELKKVTKIIDPKSEEAKYYDLRAGVAHPVHMVGNVEYTGDEYYCEKCNKYIPLEKQRQYEINSGKVKKSGWQKILPIALTVGGVILLFLVAFFTGEDAQFNLWF